MRAGFEHAQFLAGLVVAAFLAVPLLNLLTPLFGAAVPAGKHTVRAVSPSGTTRNLTINIESGKTAPVRKIEW